MFTGTKEHLECMFVRDAPVRQPLVSAVVAAGAAVGAVGSGGGPTRGHLVAARPMQGAASWGWTSAERPPLKPGTRKRREMKSIFSDQLKHLISSQKKHSNFIIHNVRP